MSLTWFDRSWKPPSAAKNGTWVVPAWVTSGPEPETAALRMRSNWTSQPTSCTLTFTPVLAVNGLISCSRSGTGLGELGIVHSVSVTPRCSFVPALAAFDELLELLSDPPQAVTADARASATAAAATANLLRTTTPPWNLSKNDFGTAAGEASRRAGGSASPPRRPAGRWSRGRPARPRACAAAGGRRRR